MRGTRMAHGQETESSGFVVSLIVSVSRICNTARLAGGAPLGSGSEPGCLLCRCEYAPL